MSKNRHEITADRSTRIEIKWPSVQVEFWTSDFFPIDQKHWETFGKYSATYFSFYSICQVCIILAFYFSQFNRLIVIISFELPSSWSKSRGGRKNEETSNRQFYDCMSSCWPDSKNGVEEIVPTIEDLFEKCWYIVDRYKKCFLLFKASYYCWYVHIFSDCSPIKRIIVEEIKHVPKVFEEVKPQVERRWIKLRKLIFDFQRWERFDRIFTLFI